MKQNTYIGSSFESFLEEEDILEEVNVAVEAIITKKLKKYLNPPYSKPINTAIQIPTIK